MINSRFTPASDLKIHLRSNSIFPNTQKHTKEVKSFRKKNYQFIDKPTGVTNKPIVVLSKLS